MTWCTARRSTCLLPRPAPPVHLRTVHTGHFGHFASRLSASRDMRSQKRPPLPATPRQRIRNSQSRSTSNRVLPHPLPAPHRPEAHCPNKPQWPGPWPSPAPPTSAHGRTPAPPTIPGRRTEPQQACARAPRHQPASTSSGCAFSQRTRSSRPSATERPASRAGRRPAERLAATCSSAAPKGELASGAEESSRSSSSRSEGASSRIRELDGKAARSTWDTGASAASNQRSSTARSGRAVPFLSRRPRLASRSSTTSSAPLGKTGGSAPATSRPIAAAPSTAAPAPAAPARWLLPLRHGDGPAMQLMAVELLHCLRARRHRLHVDEAEAARAARLLVLHDRHGHDGAKRLKELGQVLLGRREGEVADECAVPRARLWRLARVDPRLHRRRVWHELHVAGQRVQPHGRLEPLVLAVGAAHLLAAAERVHVDRVCRLALAARDHRLPLGICRGDFLAQRRRRPSQAESPAAAQRRL
mmetsp:Transcript_60710/g.160656  ORF Transcript_60710/g.160656 Transcript_60710/m.160656 type:complete len:473 (-) Transcript_60710:95-1513(-)